MSVKCPDSHPFAFGHGSSCCRHFTRHGVLNPQALRFNDDPIFCDSEAAMACPSIHGICISLLAARGDWLPILFSANLSFTIVVALNHATRNPLKPFCCFADDITCPESHPYALNRGHSCCSHYAQQQDNATLISIADGVDMCDPSAVTDCPEASSVCFSRYQVQGTLVPRRDITAFPFSNLEQFPLTCFDLLIISVPSRDSS